MKSSGRFWQSVKGLALLIFALSPNTGVCNEIAEAFVFANDSTNCETFVACSGTLVERHQSVLTDNTADLVESSLLFERDREAKSNRISISTFLPQRTDVPVPDTDIDLLRVSYEGGKAFIKGAGKTGRIWSAAAYGLAEAGEEVLDQYLDEQDRKEEQQFIQETVNAAADNIIESQRVVVENQSQLNNQIRAARQQIEETEKQLQTVLDNQAQAKDQLATLQQDAANNAQLIVSKQKEIQQLQREALKISQSIAQDVSFLKQETFASLPPSRQLAALRSGAFGDPKDQLVRVRIEQLQFKVSFDNFAAQANKAVSLATNLGIDVPEDVAWAANAINTANTVFNQLASPSPDYLGAALSVSGLFSKKTDVAGKRFGAIMSKLNVIDKKLTEILQNQKRILQGQVRILSSINALSNQIQSATELIITTTLDQSSRTRRAINDLGEENLLQCGLFAKYLEELDGKGNTLYAELSGIVDHFGSSFVDCHNAVRRKIATVGSSGTPVHSIFLMDGRVQDADLSDQWTSDFLKLSYQPLFDFFKEEVLDKSGSTAALHLLYFANPSVETLREIENIPAEADFKLLEETNVERYQGNFGSNLVRNYVIDPARLYDLFAPLVQIHFTYSFFENETDLKNTTLMTMESIRSSLESGNVGMQPQGREMLASAIALTNISIAQQNLLSGHLILQPLYEAVIGSDEAAARRALSLLRRSKILESNFFRYFVARQLEANSASVGQYEFAVRAADANQIQLLLGVEKLAEVSCIAASTHDGCPSGRLSSGFSIAFQANNSFSFFLPHPEVVRDGSFLYSNNLEGLLSLRADLAMELASYDDAVSISEELIEFNSLSLAASKGWIN